MRIVHYTRNTYEGMACAILSRLIYGDNIEIKFISKPKLTEIDSDAKIIITGLDCKVSVELDNLVFHASNNCFIEYKTFLESMFNDINNNSIYQEFVDHSLAYIDWSWRDVKKYYGKNIDELLKMYSQEELVDLIANRIHNQEELIQEKEKALLAFDKQKMNEYIEQKTIEQKEINGYKYGIVFSDLYASSILNVILKQEVDIALVIDMNKKVAYYKYNKNNKRINNFKDKIEKIGGIPNSYGGYVSFQKVFDASIITALTGNIK